MVFSDDEMQIINKVFIPVPVKRKQLILKEKQLCQHVWFVVEGCFRMYSEDDQGNEFTHQFALEEWWMGCRGNSEQPNESPYHIESLEDGLLLQASNEDLRYLYKAVPSYLEMNLNLQQRNHSKMEERLQISLNYTAEEKYANLMKTYPALLNRVPLGMIASYLGISRETLSRIRSSYRMPH